MSTADPENTAQFVCIEDNLMLGVKELPYLWVILFYFIYCDLAIAGLSPVE